MLECSNARMLECSNARMLDCFAENGSKLALPAKRFYAHAYARTCDVCTGNGFQRFSLCSRTRTARAKAKLALSVLRRFSVESGTDQISRRDLQLAPAASYAGRCRFVHIVDPGTDQIPTRASRPFGDIRFAERFPCLEQRTGRTDNRQRAKARETPCSRRCEANPIRSMPTSPRSGEPTVPGSKASHWRHG